jgi:hypothetical protein
LNIQALSQQFSEGKQVNGLCFEKNGFKYPLTATIKNQKYPIHMGWEDWRLNLYDFHGTGSQTCQTRPIAFLTDK